VTWRPSPDPAEHEPRPLTASLGRLAERLGLGPPAQLGAVFTRWEELVGPDVAAHARPHTLRDGVLTVSVDHPAWASSLKLLGEPLLARIGEAGGQPVGELVVHVERPGKRGRQPPVDTPLW
jgi:predicted nucleic acid-binding Zn ribbon protein